MSDNNSGVMAIPDNTSSEHSNTEDRSNKTSNILPTKESEQEHDKLKFIDKSIPWKFCFYKIWYNFSNLFKDPYARKHRNLHLLDQVDILINTEPEKVADVCEKYIGLHRILENTKARRRLERWITRLICLYLLCVLVLLVLDASNTIIDLSDTVVITILSTTTINIVALGIILVRGLFHEHEHKDLKGESPTKKENS